MPNQPVKIVQLRALSFKNSDEATHLQFRGVRVKIPSSVVNTLFTTPLEIVPAITGYTPIPWVMIIRKAAGAYTLGAATQLDVKWSTGGGQLMRAALASWLDSASANVEIDLGPGNGSTLYSTLGATNAGNGGALRINFTGGNTSGSGGELEVTLWYYRVRTAQ